MPEPFPESADDAHLTNALEHLLLARTHNLAGENTERTRSHCTSLTTHRFVSRSFDSPILLMTTCDPVLALLRRVHPETLTSTAAGDLVAVTLAMEQPGSDWCGIQRGTVLGPTTGGDRCAAQHGGCYVRRCPQCVTSAEVGLGALGRSLVQCFVTCGGARSHRSRPCIWLHAP